MPRRRKCDFNHSIDFLRFCSNSVLPPSRRLDRSLRQRLRPGDVLEFTGPAIRSDRGVEQDSAGDIRSGWDFGCHLVDV
jgi:hypothetical protein